MNGIFKDTKKINHLFSKLIVIHCIICGTAACVVGFLITWKTEHDVTGVLTATLSFFGGELLFLCLRNIFKKDGGTFDG